MNTAPLERPSDRTYNLHVVRLYCSCPTSCNEIVTLRIFARQHDVRVVLITIFFQHLKLTMLSSIRLLQYALREALLLSRTADGR